MQIAPSLWYVLRTRVGEDERVLQSLERLGYEGRVLWTRKLIRHNRTKKLSWRAFRLAPGYVFVSLPDAGHIGRITRCEGVVCFVGVRHRTPRSISGDELGTMLAIEAHEEFEAFVEPTPERPTFQRGDEVMVLDGLLAGARGLVVSVNGRNTASIELLSPIGSSVSNSRPVSMAIDRLAAAD